MTAAAWRAQQQQGTPAATAPRAACACSASCWTSRLRRQQRLRQPAQSSPGCSSAASPACLPLLVLEVELALAAVVALQPAWHQLQQLASVWLQLAAGWVPVLLLLLLAAGEQLRPTLVAVWWRLAAVHLRRLVAGAG